MNKEQYNYLFNKVTVFKDMEDYNNKTIDGAEQLDEALQEGFIQDLTRGVYNGATDTFTPNTLNAKELVLAVQQYLYETDWLSTLYTQHEEDDDLETFEQLTRFDMLEDYLNCYSVFTIGNRIYADIS
ncbi:hypothetical protein HOR18_gp021 [Staphylococcus phage vB_SscM-1]|uniref:Uncharacterized protein n=2 Tax=Sciuriunavirus SscM1 TaxID=2734053 RepID=A0A1X9I9E8_9CAUD|nr:hypothetical protein HOR18_gp021 [Staphylococcus phage vB_SscM-1]ANT44684.1 hypothetical protein vB_SscM-1_021 [Staphylococcus phage vB_SscM-1]ANT44887.1 hypothetical protein vB_SscM-2_020 [Staphylococcus phage vB_SscM-2]